MLTQIRRFLATPVFEDEDKKRAASLLNIISLALLGVTVVSTIFILLEEGFNIPDLAIGIAASLLEVGVQFLMRRDHVKLASLIQSSILWIMLTAMTVFFGGVRAATFSSYVLIILMTGLLLGSYAGIVAAGLSVAAGLVMLYLESQNILISFPGVDPVSALVTQSSHFILSAIMVHATVRSLRNALERARNSNRELQTVQASLEQRMAAHQEQRDHLQTTVEEYTDYLVEVELGNLAEQSRQATAQVRDILLDIQSGINATVMATEEGVKVVDEGVQLASGAGDAIEGLSSVIDQSAQAAMQMVAGGRQQASGVEQIALAMQNINQATQQSLASTRQAERAAQDLNDLARQLAEIVEQYRL